MAVLWQRHPRLKISQAFRVLCFLGFYFIIILFHFFLFVYSVLLPFQNFAHIFMPMLGPLTEQTIHELVT